MIEISCSTELQCGQVELVEEVEKDPDRVFNERCTPGAAGSTFGSSSTPMTDPFFLAMMKVSKWSFGKRCYAGTVVELLDLVVHANKLRQVFAGVCQNGV